METIYKYEVVINVIILDANGKNTNKNEPLCYTFSTGDLPTMRNEAFDKANDMIEFFENEIPAGHEFDSPFEAELKGYKNIQSYSLGIYFFINDFNYQIEGDDEAKDESLEVEEFEFKRWGFEVFSCT